jgi:hypothetical protein
MQSNTRSGQQQGWEVQNDENGIPDEQRRQDEVMEFADPKNFYNPAESQIHGKGEALYHNSNEGGSRKRRLMNQQNKQNY